MIYLVDHTITKFLELDKGVLQAPKVIFLQLFKKQCLLRVLRLNTSKKIKLKT